MLDSTLGMDVLTNHIMSNHIDVILCNRLGVVATWTDEEAVLRWLRLFPGAS